jgi:CheY-like chemotaxis protein
MARILVVDDDPDFVEVTRTILAADGYDVATAADGAGAIAEMRKVKPDLVILDVMMSSILDGLDVSRQMSGDAKLKGVPIVMVSSISATEHAAAFPTDEYLPVDSWISKPVKADELRATVRRLLA